MGTDGLGKKVVFAAVAAGALLLVLRIVGGRDAEGIDRGGIERVDTGRSDEDREGGPVETGLDRVSTDDSETDEASELATGEGSETTTEEGDETRTDEGDETTTEEGDESDEIAVEPTGGRFDDLDLFDVVAILGAGFEAAREEYRDRA